MCVCSLHLSDVLVLLRLESQFDEDLLQLLVAVVDDELLKTVPLKRKKSSNLLHVLISLRLHLTSSLLPPHPLPPLPSLLTPSISIPSHLLIPPSSPPPSPPLPPHPLHLNSLSPPHSSLLTPSLLSPPSSHLLPSSLPRSTTHIPRIFQSRRYPKLPLPSSCHDTSPEKEK